MTNSVNVSGGSSGSINVNATNSTTNASATSASGSSSVETVNNAAWFWANLAKEWAIKMSGLVQGEDYSSKYWAQESKGYAEQAEEIIQSKDEILAELEQEGNTQIGLIEDAGTEQIGLVESSTDAQIERIEDAGDTQITNITNVSNTNIATINGLIGDAQSAANAAANSAQSASNSATSASNSSTSASNSANSAQSSATEAASSASSASDSATAAATSAQSAAGSATSASNSATAASGSASSAQSSATSASNSASSASSSATSASNSATNAASSASAAATSEDNAEIWAEGTDEEVQALGGIHSAKGWADVSSAGQIQADWEETDTTSKAYIRNKPSNFASSISDLTDVDLTGLSNGDVLVYDSTSQEWKAEAQSGGVTDVEVNGESVVTDGVAEIDLSNYQEKLTAGTDLEIVEGSTLPSGYTELTSITSTGTQWINSGIKLTNNFKSIIVGRLVGTQISNFRTVLAAQNNNLSVGKQNVLLGWGNATNGFYTEPCTGPTYVYSSYPWDTNTHTFTTNVTPTVTTLDIDGVINTVNSAPSITGVNLAIFARLAQNNTVNSQVKFELNSIELYQSGVLVFNGVPAKRNADGEIGLYETVSDTFLTNSGTGTFDAGAEVPADTVINFTNDTGYITGIDSTDVTTALGYTPYNSTNPNGYITSSALNGYATETWVGQQGYLTGITSAQVTTALGYTPYDATNPNGYTSNVGTVTSVNNELPDANGNVTIQSGSSRNIGEIVKSTIPLTDAGLHLLDGSLISGDGIYSDFVDYVQDLYIDTSTPDGTNWTPAESGTAGNENVRFLNGQFITISGNNLNTSTDGVNWTTTTLTDFSSAQIDGIAYGNNKYVALGYAGYISTSTDGVSWTTPVQNSSLGSNAWESVAYGNGKFVAIGRSKHVSTSTDGTTWTTASTAISAGLIWMSIAYGNGKFVAINSQGYIATTTDGITWTSATQNSNLGNNSWEAIEFDGTKFVAISYSGYISTSTDGVNWTVATQNSNLGNNNWVGLAYGNGKFIATTTSKRSYSYNIASGIFDTEANWQSAVTQYGVCGKFVYDSVNSTVRLPKITGIIEGTTDLTALGDLVAAGLPNITGAFNTYILSGATSSNYWTLPSGGYTGAFAPTSTSKATRPYYSSAGTSTATWDYGSKFDASASNSIYGNSSKVQPQTIKVLYYIVVATTTKTDVQVDIDEIATDLNGKADVDLTNCTDVADIKMAHNAMPSDRYIDLTLGASGTTYTAPADGYIYFSKDQSGSTQQYAVITGASDGIAGQLGDGASMNGYGVHILRPVKKGTTFKVNYTLTGTTHYFRFIYAVGSESEA